MKINAAGKNIILTGFMAAGKTEVGRKLAARLGRRLIDTDRLVEKKAGLSIPQIFERYGEQYFRDLESAEILGLDPLHPEKLVVSTGGGAVLREANRAHLLRIGVVVLLTASTETLLQRIRDQKDRPLLEGEKLKERIESLWAEREPYYRQCHLEIDTSGGDPGEAADRIIQILGLE